MFIDTKRRPKSDLHARPPILASRIYKLKNMKNNKFRHGGELKNTDSKIKYDFSVNINPLGLPEAVKKALAESHEAFTDYPDPDCRQLRNAIAEKEGVSPEQIVCGNGASDIIYRICEALNIKHALIPVPAFSEYERALNNNNAYIEYLYTEMEYGFALTPEAFEKWTEERAEAAHDTAEKDTELPDAIFLCTPTNPSGRLLDSKLIEKAAAWCAENNAALIVDECFLEFHENRNSLTAINIIKNINKESCKNNCRDMGAPARTSSGAFEHSSIHSGIIIVINAFTKIYSMAGLRLGYAVCSDAETARMISERGPHWNVSGPAQAAGIAALRESDYLEKTVKYIKNERERMSKELSDVLAEKDSTFRTFKSDANYILFTAPPGLAEAMVAEGIAIRDCRNYEGLAGRPEHYYRIAVRTPKEDDEMFGALRRCLKWL